MITINDNNVDTDILYKASNRFENIHIQIYLGYLYHFIKGKNDKCQDGDNFLFI